MSLRCAIEFNDAGLCIVDDGGMALSSPGYLAQDAGEQLHAGQAARNRARLNPRQCWHRYWHRLDQQPLDNMPRNGRQLLASHADMAWFHLDGLWREYLETRGQGVDEVILCVPGSMGYERLALLLGIAGACEIPVRGLVDSAVAASTGLDSHGARLHLDAGLHRQTVTVLDETGSATSSLDVSEQGLVALESACVRGIAQAFVSQTRFDPLHDAATEQALFLYLPRLWDALRGQGQGEVRLTSAGREYHITVRQTQLAEILSQWWSPLLVEAESADQQVAVGHYLAAVPGLCAALADMTGRAPTCLAASAAGEGALRHADQIIDDGEGFRLVQAIGNEVVA